MQILVTGAHGKVGAATIHELVAAGHSVTGCDVVAPVYEGGDSAAHYVQADLTDAGDAFAQPRIVRGGLNQIAVFFLLGGHDSRSLPDLITPVI